MKFLTTLLTAVAMLSINVAANNKSLASEMMFLYYAYKMDYLANPGDGATASRKIGDACRKRKAAAGGLCGFSEFINDVMSKNFKPSYNALATTSDKTTTPGDAERDKLYTAIQNFGGTGANYKEVKIGQAKIDRSLKKEVPYGDFFRKNILDYIRQAMASGTVNVDDARAASDYSNKALGVRFSDNTGKQVLLQSMQDHIDSDAAKYLKTDPNTGWIDWQATCNAVDGAYSPTDPSKEPTGTALKQKYLTFASNLQAGVYKGTTQTDADNYKKDVIHIDILQGLQVSSDQINRRTAGIAAGGSIPHDATLDAQCKLATMKRKRAADVLAEDDFNALKPRVIVIRNLGSRF